MHQNDPKVAARVASRVLQAGEEDPGADPVTALPKSGPGKNLVQKHLDTLNKAFQDGDDTTFKTTLEKLQQAGR